MAPKTRSGKVRGTVVTKKVVKETVQIIVSPGAEGKGEDEDERMEVVSETIKENEKVEVISSSAKRSPEKVIVVRDKAEEEDQPPPLEQPEEGPERPQQEQENQDDEQQQAEQRPQQQPEEEQAEAVLQPEKGKAQVEEESEAEDEETQPASQTEVTPAPTPPRFEQPPRKEEEERGKKRKTKEEETVKDDQKKKTTQKGGGGKRRKKRAKVGGGGAVQYNRYVFRVMKQVHPDMAISSKAMTIINNLMSDMFERIADEASKLSSYIGRATLSSMEIQDAVKLVLPGDLGKHAIAEGSKAVTNYAASVTGDTKFKTKTKS